MSNARNFFSPAGAWSNTTQYSAYRISAPTFDGTLLISCPVVTYNNSSYYCTLDQTPTVGVTPSTALSGWTVLDASASFPPAVSADATLTCSSPGDLAITYLFNDINYNVTGRVATVSVALQTQSFTYTTATGTVVIDGVPTAVLPVGASVSGNVVITGYDWTTNTDTKQIFCAISSLDNNSLVLYKNEGDEILPLAITDLPTAGTITLYINITYPVA